MPDPRVSLLMVARNAERHIDAALHSARRQTFRHIEIVVVDDGSSDATPQIAECHALADPRVRVIAGPQRGLAAVRNASLDAARGRYAAILDSDDLLHPEHVEVLFSTVTRHRAEIVACNMVAFSDAVPRRAELFARGPKWGEERTISASEFVDAGRLDQRGPSLGYLKPMFDLRFLRGSGFRYDTALRIGEDYDLVDRALRSGATYVVAPRATYFYRQHDKSTSHRLTRADLVSLIASERTKAGEPTDRELCQASRLRARSLGRALAHLETIEALKSLDLRRAWRMVAREPALLPMLAASAFEGIIRRLRALAARSPGQNGRPAKRALLLGRAPSGSAIAAAARRLRADGYEIHPIACGPVRKMYRKIARAGPFDAILLGEEDAIGLAPFALSPEAPLIGDSTIDPALVDIVASRTHDGRLACRVPGPKRLGIGEAVARFRQGAAPVAAR